MAELEYASGWLPFEVTLVRVRIPLPAPNYTTRQICVYKLIAQGTIEQRMVELQERKKLLAQSIYHEDGNASLAFTEADLDELLKPIEEVD